MTIDTHGLMRNEEDMVVNEDDELYVRYVNDKEGWILEYWTLG